MTTETRLTIPGNPHAVHEALRGLAEGALSGLAEAERNTAQIVLAEVLNNIVEHAYAEQGGGIDLLLWVEAGGLRCVVTDRGAPMPSGRLPKGRSPHPGDLPQGGFGWFLIRSLARDLRYRRAEGRNELSFCLPS
ncbi:ATP-binding protein [Cereibacter sp. SYSU M97828]|nr:ATP-binding protein [Cereibacter flavus]